MAVADFATASDIGMSPSGKAPDFDSGIRRFKSGHPSQKKASRKTCFFLSNPKDWYVIAARSAVHGIRRFATAWHHAPSCICLRIDAIHHFVMISYVTSCRFHAATSCGFHTRLRRDWDAEDAYLKPRTDSNRHNSKIICKAIDAKAFWTDLNYRNT